MLSVFAPLGPYFFQRQRVDGLGMVFGFDLQNNGPAPQHRPSQPDKNPLAIDLEAFGIEPVVLTGNVQKCPYMLVVLEFIEQFVTQLIAGQLGGNSSIVDGALYQSERPVFFDHRNPGQEKTIAIAADSCQTLGVFLQGLGAIGFFPFQAVRPTTQRYPVPRS